MTSPAEYLRPLVKDDYLVASFGDATGSVPYRLLRATPFSLVYDPVKQGVLSGSLGATTFLDNQQFALSASVTNLSGVTDIFQVQADGEILQLWFGVAPRQLRVWAKQPYGQFVGVMDNNMNPQASFPDLGYVHGFDSPFDRPAPRTEMTVFKNIGVNWALYNPGPWPINPRFYFFVNRMFVQVVKDPKVAVALLNHQVPAHHVSIGNPQNTVTYTASSYEGVKPIPSSLLQKERGPGLLAALAKLGYCVPA